MQFLIYLRHVAVCLIIICLFIAHIRFYPAIILFFRNYYNNNAVFNYKSGYLHVFVLFKLQTSALVKPENAENDLQWANLEVSLLREEESKLRQENLQLKVSSYI